MSTIGVKAIKYPDGDSAINITDGGNVTLAGTLNVTGETTLATHLNLGDNDKIKLGASGDLEIYHNASNSYMKDVGTGKMHITSNGTGVSIDKGTSENMATFDTDGAVSLFHDGTKKFETTSGGVTVTGNVAMTSDDPTITMTDSSGTNDIATIQSTSGALIFTARDGSSDGEIIFKKTDGSATDETMRINNSGNVGIGTNSPAFAVGGGLQVKGSSFTSVRVTSGGNTGIDFSQTTSGVSYLYNRDNADLIFGTNDTERVRIDSIGRVMIAETSNSGYSNNADDLIVGDNGSNTERGISIGSTLAGTIRFNDGSDAGIIEYAHNSNYMRFITSTAERMRIDQNGNVGIGTSSPSGHANLHIAGTQYAFLALQSTNTGGRQYELFSYASDQSFHLYDRTAGAYRLTVDETGKVGVGVTSMSLHQMHVHGATGGNATFKVANTSTSGNTTTYLSFMDGSGSASVNSAHFQGFNGANNFYLLGNGTTTFTSDEIAKKNIETTRDGYLEDLAKLRVVKYNWKEDEDGADKELGLIAQEVEKVFPKLVMLDIDPQIEEKDKKKMIKTTVLPFMLLKALQESLTRIETLEAEVKALKG